MPIGKMRRFRRRLTVRPEAVSKASWQKLGTPPARFRVENVPQSVAMFPSKNFGQKENPMFYRVKLVVSNGLEPLTPTLSR